MKRSSILVSMMLAAVLGNGTLMSSARADDGGDRRVLKARQVAETDQSEEYAKLAEEKRLESIKFLKDLLGKGGVEGDQKAEMMLRLADLYFAEGRYIFLGEMKKFDASQEKCFNTEGCDEQAMKPDNTVSKEWQEKSIKLYQAILKSYPRYARADEATYYLGSALQDTGFPEDAVEQFTNLVKLYPDSVWVPDAYVAIGEYWFEHDQAYKALLAYKKATAYPESDMYGFATYKLGWCYYNVGEYDNAITTMQGVVKLGAGAADKSKLQLEEEALNDLVRFFADADKLDDAEVYFRSLGKPDLYLKALKRIGATFFEQGKWDQAVAVYRKLIAESPNGASAPGYQVEIIRAYKKLQKRDEILTEVTSLLKTYGKTSAWAKANAANPEALASAQEAVELQVRTAAVEYHEYARKLKTGDEAKAYYALAYKSYKLYLDEFGDNPHAYEMHYAFGELLYKVKRFDEAYGQYMAVVKLNPQGEHSKFCAESAIFSADEQIKKEQVANPPPTTPSKEAIPLTEWEQKLIDACAQYATLYPSNDPKNISIIYKSAYLLYNKAHYSEAAEQFNKVIAMNPQSQQAMDAAHLMLDQFKIQENWSELKKNAKFYFDQEGLGTTAFKAEVHEIYERASFKLIEVTLAQDSDKGKAADAFMAFYGEFPNSDVAAQALNNATVYFEAVSRPGDSIAARKILVEDPKFGPKTKYYYDQVGALGFDYETIADFASAAGYYEKLFTLYPKRLEVVKAATPDQVEALSKQASDALYSAAVFRKASGGWEKSIDDYKQFVAAFPVDPRTDDVKLTIGKIWEEQKRYTEAAAVYYGFYSKAAKDANPEIRVFRPAPLRQDARGPGPEGEGRRGLQGHDRGLQEVRSAARRVHRVRRRDDVHPGAAEIRQVHGAQDHGLGQHVVAQGRRHRDREEPQGQGRRSRRRREDVRRDHRDRGGPVGPRVPRPARAGLREHGRHPVDVLDPVLPRRGSAADVRLCDPGQGVPADAEGDRGVLGGAAEGVRAHPLRRQHGARDPAARRARPRELPGIE